MTTEAPTPQNPGRSLLRVLIPTAVIAALAVGALLVVRSQVAQTPRQTEAFELVVGAQMPEFHLVPVGAPNEKRTLADLKAKVILVNFWASWCQACVVEMPSIVALRNAYKDKGFEVAAVNVDDKPETAVPPLAKRLKMDFTIYSDPDQKLGELFEVSAIPLTVILDSQRRILMIQPGELDWNSVEVRAQLEKWLSG